VSVSGSADFLRLAGKRVVVAGVANRKSVAWFVDRALREAGAEIVHLVRSEARRDQLAKLLAPAPVLACDVEHPEQIARAAAAIAALGPVDGLVHSIAFARYAPDSSPAAASFEATPRADFLQAVDVSCYSLMALADALRPSFAPGASVVTISISSTAMAAESYGYMAPIKAALDASVVLLAKSFAGARVRFNAVKAGPLKTSASAGIPGYLDNYLYAEAATMRHAALETREVADAAVFLLSPRSSGINAQGIVVDAGMGSNYFDREIVRRFHRGDGTRPDAEAT
jgi:enoyl-[acyl-carrier protein] reductase I